MNGSPAFPFGGQLYVGVAADCRDFRVEAGCFEVADRLFKRVEVDIAFEEDEVVFPPDLVKALRGRDGGSPMNWATAQRRERFESKASGFQ